MSTNPFHPRTLLAPDNDSQGTSSGPRFDPETGLPILDPQPGDAAPARRAGSMTLRDAGGQSTAAALDPANQSLADALNVVYKLVIFTMIGLVIAWILSGFKFVQEGERGVRVLFGRIQESNLEPGFRWSAPFPIGQLVRIQRGNQNLRIDREFWFFVAEGGDPSPDKNTPQPSLNPDQGNSGSLITADGNIAHASWTVDYSRQSVGDYALNMHPDHELALVRSAAMRGVVSAVSQTTIETLLKQGGEDGTNPVASRARIIAQDILDRVESGIQIDQFILTAAIPPLFVRSDFAAVQSAVAKANQERERAESDARRTLNEVAGDAAPDLLALIDRYELALAQSRDEEATTILAQIDQVLLDRRRSVDGRVLEGRTSGKVAQLLDEAELYRSREVSRRQRDLARYTAKLAQYEANPSLMITRYWTEAYQRFLSRPSVEVMLLPQGTDIINLKLNRDPAIEREQDRARKAREAEQARIRREAEMRDARFRTQTNVEVSEQ
jgi:membrane protease subunit HflK